MEKLSFNLEKYHPKKAPAHYWQEQALEAIAYLDNPVKSQVFRWFKCNESRVKASLDYMKENNKKSFTYLAKLMSL